MKFKKFWIVFICLLITGPVDKSFAITQTNEPVATASEVLVLYNSDYVTDSNSSGTQDSLEIANYYKTKRSIPDANVIGISAPTTEEITRAQFTTLQSTIETAITDAGLEDSIKYIVLTKGMPLKILPTSGDTHTYTGDYASVDSSLTILYSSAIGSGKNVNPYYNSGNLTDLTYRFKENTFDLGGGEYLKFLVTRLDGYTVADVTGMIDRAYSADTSGTGYFVLDGNSNIGILDSMSTVATSFTTLNKNFSPNPFSRGSTPITSLDDSVIGYVSYGKYSGLPSDYYNNTLDFTYLNGAVAATYESYNNWGYTQDASLYDSHGQIAEFVESGGSGGIGHVYEPFAATVAQEKIWMVAYAAGYTWADAAYMSMPYIDWQHVVTGDPLMRIVADGLDTPTVTTGSSSSVMPTTVTLGGNITDLGGENNTVRGVQYGTTASYGSSSSESGDFSTGAFTIDLTGLICNTTYHYRAYSTNSFRTGFGSDDTFTTSPCVSPSITTGSASSITNTTATLGGTIVDVGVANPTIRGFQYGTTTSYGSTTNESGDFSTGAYTLGITGLSCYTTYHFRAYATNSNGTTYGSDNTFTTLHSCVPTVTISSESSITKTAVTFNGTITDGGNEVVTTRGFQYGTTDSYGSTTTESGLFSGELGYVSTLGSYGSGSGQFNQPRDVVLDSDGNIYVLERLNHRVQKFDSSGTYITSWGSFGTGNTQFNYPFGIAIDSDDNIYVADSDNHKLKKFDSDGTYITSWGGYGTGNGKLSYPQDVAIDSDDYVYVSDYDNSRITKFTSDGTYVLKWGSAGSGDGQFNPATSLAIDSSDNIYIADKTNNRVQKFDSSGTFITKFGSSGSGNVQFITPTGIAIDSDDNIYVSDSGNSRIQKFDSDHLYVTEFGSSGSGNSGFSNVEDLFVDSSGNLFIADKSNSRVQKYAGSALASFTANVSDLTCGTTYHYRSYATNTRGTSYSSDDIFDTTDCDSASVDTDSASSVTTTTVTLNGEITAVGEGNPTTRGFNYGTTISYGSTTTENGDFSTGTYTSDVSGLSCGTTYHFRSYITNITSTFYGSDDTFTTGSCPNVSGSSGGGGGGGSSSRINLNTPLVVATSQLKPINIPLPKVQNFVQSNLIRIGARGENVKVLQTFLKAQGSGVYPPDEPIDGIFGPKTQKAVKSFQALNNLKVDGIVGPNTKLAMDSTNTKKYCFVPVEVVTC